MDLRKEFDDNVIWQWANNCPTCAGALVAAGRGDDSALGILQSGQSNNQHVQDVYRDAFIYGALKSYGRVWRGWLTHERLLTSRTSRKTPTGSTTTTSTRLLGHTKRGKQRMGDGSPKSWVLDVSLKVSGMTPRLQASTVLVTTLIGREYIGSSQAISRNPSAGPKRKWKRGLSAPFFHPHELARPRD